MFVYMRAWRKGERHRAVEEKIAEKILGAAVIGTTVLISPLAGTVGFFLAVGAMSYLFRKSDFNREVKRLEKKEYLALTKTEKGWLLRITEKGKRRFQKIQIKNMVLPSPKTWDGKWRLLIFDIPEKYRYERDAMRQKLKSLGLYNIQRSVFVYPHDCQAQLELIADSYLLDKYCTYLETSFIDIDKELRRHFNLHKIKT